MDFTSVKAGDEIEIGPLIAFRFWRYSLRPLQLLSWLPVTEWSPYEALAARTLPTENATDGIHAWKTYDGLREYIGGVTGKGPTNLYVYAYRGDGIILGTVELWGVTRYHKDGYRAQYARPLAFLETYGRNRDEAIARLRERFKR